ncbi:MAG TPA: 16S rRNA (cytosine(967)-C(5))-methyltransferase RsmB [Candidatus Blautia stercoravium]|nr:16S rRNA (cytosine(967)-C(5))-methyltransferase RsmB [Candidatus Blautia stercoravium]
MMNKVNLRELILEILLEISKEERHSHLVIRRTLEKYQYLEKQERAFITRVCEGTLEYRLRLDYILNQYSTVPTEKMKPVIRELLRSGVYQMLYMDRVPDSAVCNEAVKLARKKGFYNLAGFVNGVLRKVAREYGSIRFPQKSQPVEYLSVMYSMPVWLVERFLKDYGFEKSEKIFEAFLEDSPTTIRIREYLVDKQAVLESLERQKVLVEKAPYVENAYYLKNYDYLPALEAFRMGNIQVQDVSSMLVAEIADPKEGDYVIDLCAAPGGKSLCIADKLKGTGRVDARDISRTKTDLIRENAVRQNFLNVVVTEKDATELDSEALEKADILLADVPCSGLGVIGRKTDIKYNMSQAGIQELAGLQRKILEQASTYVKPGGTLIYSTCTVTPEENIENVRWFTERYPYELESLDPYLCEELRGKTTKEGYLQLLPGIHHCDGFFIARLKRKTEWNR